MDNTLTDLGFTPTDADCLYFKKKNKNFLFVGIYVDDIIIASTDFKWLLSMKTSIMNKFRMNYLLSDFFKHGKNSKEIFLSQKQYILDILNKYGMKDCKPLNTLLEVCNVLKKPAEEDQEIMRMLPFQSLIGSLMYIAVATRPGIAYTVNSLRLFDNCYLKGTPDFG